MMLNNPEINAYFLRDSGTNQLKTTQNQPLIQLKPQHLLVWVNKEVIKLTHINTQILRLNPTIDWLTGGGGLHHKFLQKLFRSWQKEKDNRVV